ncbi:MAG: non-homologous end-joining DNA ligase [Solirubrobacterales bacterium]
MASQEPLPRALSPMLAKMAPLPEGQDWAYEIKWDGVRALGYANAGKWQMTNRRGQAIGVRYPELAPIAERLGKRGAVLDGEVVVFDGEGKPSFQLIQRRMGLTAPDSIEQRVRDTPVCFILFDLLHLDGESTRELAYPRRRELLEGLELEGENWQTPGYHPGPGADLFEAARRQGLEGVVAKRLDSPYRPGRRSGEWVKSRIWRRQEFVIGGWIPGEGSRSGRVGSLLVGYYESGRLAYAGGVGSGLKESDLDHLTGEMKARERPDSPFDTGGPKGARARSARWVEPELVCEVSWTEWTHEGTLRQPAFKGMRDDKNPREVVREL